MKKFFVMLFALIIGLSVATGCGGTSTSSTSSSSSSTSQVEDTTLSSISVKTLPYKLKYYSHETINTAGGQIELAFTNNTKQVIDMSDDMVNYSSVNMATLGKQNVELRYTYKGVTKSTTYQVEIEDSNIYVTNIYLDKDYAEIMVGGGVALKEIVLPKNATNQAVEWVSSDPSIAIVSNQGVVEGLKEGSVVITVTAKDKGTKIATATIVVKNPTDDTITVTLRRELTLSLQTVYEKYDSSSYTSSNYEILTGYYNEGIEGISSAKTSTEANAAFVNATRKMALVAVNVTTPVVDYAEFSFSGDDLTVTSGGLVNPTSIGRSVVANLVIAASVGDEEVTLDGITVTGTTTVNGGGSHSIIAVNVVFVGTITIDKDPTTGEETVRVEFSITTTVISDIVVADNATLTANTPLPSVTVNATVTTALIQGSSSIGQITAAASIEVDIDGVVDSLEVSSGATSAPTITINSTVQLITNNYSGAEIEGNGQISNMIAAVSTTVAVTVPVTNVELSGGTLTVNQPVNNVVVTASTSVVITGSSTVDYVDVPSTTSGTLSVSVANTIVSNQSSNAVTVINITETITITTGQTKLTNNGGDDIVDVTALSDLKKIELAKLERKFAALNSLYYSSANYSIISDNYDDVKAAINASADESELDVAKANIDYIDYSDGTSSGSHITASAYILKIEDNLSASIYRGNSTTLPSSIEVTLKNPNGTTSTNQSVSVTWNSVDQTQLGYGVHQVVGEFASTYLNSLNLTPRFSINVAQPITATLESLDNYGIHDSKVYAAYKLMHGETEVGLTSSNLTSISVLKPGDEAPTVLTPDSDPYLWFNVNNAAGTYQYNVLTKNGTAYRVVFNWSPSSQVALKTGTPEYNATLGETYQLYVVSIDADPVDTKVYQIKPDGTASELTVLSDDDEVLNLWFRQYRRDNSQQQGEHKFYIVKDGVWSKTVINYIYSWSHLADTSWYEGHETDTSYSINNEEELAGLAVLVNGTSSVDFENKTIILADDVDLSDYEWIPIGNTLKPFKGTFDGNEKTISGLKITTAYDGSWYNGFFGYNDGGEVKDITFSGANVQFLHTSEKANMAIVSGYSVNTNFTNVHISGGTVSGSRVASITGLLSGTGVMNNCSSSATINATPIHSMAIIGGLVQQVEVYTSSTDTTVTTTDNINVTAFIDCEFTGTINVNATNFNQSTSSWLWVGQIFGGTSHENYYNLGIQNTEANGTVNITNLSANTPYLENTKLSFVAYVNGNENLSYANHTANGSGITPIDIVKYGRVLETYGIYTVSESITKYYNGVYNQTSGVLYDDLTNAVASAVSGDTLNLCENTTISSAMTIPEGVLLQANEYTITVNSALTVTSPNVLKTHGGEYLFAGTGSLNVASNIMIGTAESAMFKIISGSMSYAQNCIEGIYQGYLIKIKENSNITLQAGVIATNDYESESGTAYFGVWDNDSIVIEDGSTFTTLVPITTFGDSHTGTVVIGDHVELNVAYMNGGYYPTLQSAIGDAINGDSIELLGNMNLGDAASVIDGNKSITLQLAGYTITSSTTNWVIRVSSGSTLVIGDNSEGNTGAVINTGQYGEVLRNYGTLTINGGTYSATHADGGYALIMANRTGTTSYTSVTTINDGTFNGWVYDNGTDSYCRLVINDGIFTRMFYIASAYSDVTINDGTFTSAEEALIEIDAGTLTINDGLFAHNIATNNISEIASNNGSGAFKGVIIGVKPSNSTTGAYGSPVVINLNGGTFSNTLGDVIVLADQTTNSTHAGGVTVNVTADTSITAASDKNAIAIYDDSTVDNGGCVVNVYAGVIRGNVVVSENAGSNSVINSIYNQTQEELYSDLQTAITASEVDDVIFVNSDLVVTSSVTIANTKDLTIILNGKKISRVATDYSQSIFEVQGSLIVSGNGTIESRGSSNPEEDGYFKGRPIIVSLGGEFTLNNGTITGGDTGIVIKGNQDATTWETVSIDSTATIAGGVVNGGTFIFGKGATLNVQDGTINGVDNWASPILGNGTVNSTTNNGGTIINISGGTLSNPDDVVIYHPQNGILNITGGTLIGDVGIEIKSGTINMSAGTISADGAHVEEPVINGNGSSDNGDGIFVNSHASYTGDIIVNITGGSITSTNGYAVREYISTGGIRKSTVTIDDNATLSGALGEWLTVPEIIGDVTGNITANQSGQVSGTLSFEGSSLTVTAQVTDVSGYISTFEGTISGVISGNISGSIHSGGIDTLSGVITNTGATQPVRILGVFPQTGTAGDFEGEIISGEIPTYATSMEIVGDNLVVSDGGTIELTIAEDALLDPKDVAWSVYVNNTAIASLSGVEAQTGYVTTADGVVTVNGLSAGTATIIAKSTDGSLLQDTITITVDATAPTIDSVSPAEGMLQLQTSETFIFVVDASDAVGLYELEIDHSMSATLPEFSLYADSTDVYGDSESATQFAAAGVQASYNETEQRWSIDFGTDITNAIVANHGITIYIVVKDLAGNQFGSMYTVTEDNTFAYTVTRAS